MGAVQPSRKKLESGAMRPVLALIAGAFMLVSSLAHGLLGWSAMRGELAKVGAPADLVGGLRAGWLFGSASMAAFGAIVLVSALRLRRGDLSGVFALRVVALCYLVFGAAAFVALGFEPFFLSFVATGALAGASALGSGAGRTEPR
jgi:hypothetical protein